MFVKVSQDYVEMIADMTYNGAVLRDEHGDAKVEKILEVLGFTVVDGRVQYSILDKEGTLLRNPEKPYEVMTMIVYEGVIRPDFKFKSIYEGHDVMIGNFTYGVDKKTIDSVESFTPKGESYYNKAGYTPVEYADRHAEIKGTESLEAEY